MTDRLLSEGDQKERLSLVYAKALAARAGFVTYEPDLDRDSVDLRIQADGPQRPALDLQLKATANISEPRKDLIPYRLSNKNYEDLRAETQTPRLLVVLELPKDKTRWMTVTSEKLILRRRAYWLSLQMGHHDMPGQKSVTVHIPEANIFDVHALRTLMERSRTRGSI